MISAFTTGAPQEGIEPTAFRLEAGRSLLLSYWGRLTILVAAAPRAFQSARRRSIKGTVQS